MTQPLDTPDWAGQTLPANAVNPINGSYLLLAGNSQVLVPAAAGVTLRLLTLLIQVLDTSSTPISLQDTAGTQLFLYSGRGPEVLTHDFGGYVVPTGRGIQMHNNGGVAMNNSDNVNLMVSS